MQPWQKQLVFPHSGCLPKSMKPKGQNLPKVRFKESKWSYHISPKKLAEYVGHRKSTLESGHFHKVQVQKIFDSAIIAQKGW